MLVIFPGQKPSMVLVDQLSNAWSQDYKRREFVKFRHLLAFLHILKTEPSTQRPAAPAENDPWQHPAVDLGVKPLSCRTPGWRICTGNELLLLGHKDHAQVNDHNECLMAVYSSGFLYFATTSPDVILCREGEMGRYVVPYIVKSWRMEKWKSKDYFKTMLMKKRQTVTVLSIYSLICSIFSINYSQS